MSSNMPSDEQIWQDWLQWLPTAPSIDRPAPIFGHYRAKLLQAGISEAEANRQVATILRLMRTQTEGWRVIFNNIYANPNPGFDTDPNALLVSAVEGRTPGRALDVSTGQGRNALFLAIQGWDVTATDISEEGLKISERNAEQVGVHIHTMLTSNEAFDLGTAAWDLIVMTYAPVPIADPAYAKRNYEALRPSGLIVVESFASDAAAQRRTPVDIDPAQLQQAFTGFRILHFEDTLALTDWEPQEMRVARLIAEK